MTGGTMVDAVAFRLEPFRLRDQSKQVMDPKRGP